MKFFYNTVIFVILSTLLSTAAPIDSEKKSHGYIFSHAVVPVTSKTFQSRVGSKRMQHCFVGFFYEDEYDPSWIDSNLDAPTTLDTALGIFDNAAKLVEGVIQFFAMEVDENRPFVLRLLGENARFPVIYYFPLLPQPLIPFSAKWETMQIVGFTKQMTIGRNIQQVTESTLSRFSKFEESVPICIMFTDKSSPSFNFKGLSMDFYERIQFGMMKVDTPGKYGMFNVTQIPAIALLTLNAPNAPLYAPNLQYYRELHDFINPYAETFIRPGSDKEKRVKPIWELDTFPELDGESARHICFIKDARNVQLCAIYTKGAKELTEYDIKFMEMSRDRQKKLFSDTNTTVKWMWINFDKEKAWSEFFKLPNDPGFIIINPHKRIRYIKLKTMNTMDSINALFDEIHNGDAKYTRIYHDEFPPFADPNSTGSEL